MKRGFGVLMLALTVLQAGAVHQPPVLRGAVVHCTAKADAADGEMAGMAMPTSHGDPRPELEPSAPPPADDCCASGVAGLCGSCGTFAVAALATVAPLAVGTVAAASPGVVLRSVARAADPPPPRS